jgi:hypothetical protein
MEIKTDSATVKDKNTATRIFSFSLFCLLSAYSYGTAMMDYFLVYPSRLIVGENEFVTYHTLLENMIIPISVLPFLVITLLNFVLLWYRPTFVSGRFLWFSFVCLILDWLSTALLQIPMNLELNHGKNQELIQQVMDTNWGRVILESAQFIIVSVMLVNALMNSSVKEKDQAYP